MSFCFSLFHSFIRLFLVKRWCHPDVYIDYTHYYLTSPSITQTPITVNTNKPILIGHYLFTNPKAMSWSFRYILDVDESMILYDNPLSKQSLTKPTHEDYSIFITKCFIYQGNSITKARLGKLYHCLLLCHWIIIK